MYLSIGIIGISLLVIGWICYVKIENVKSECKAKIEVIKEEQKQKASNSHKIHQERIDRKDILILQAVLECSATKAKETLDFLKENGNYYTFFECDKTIAHKL